MEDRLTSPLQAERQRYVPRLPSALQGSGSRWEAQAASTAIDEAIMRQFPHIAGLPQLRRVAGAPSSGSAAPRVGVLLSGGQAPGGHNVISGLFDALQQRGGELLGFLGGPIGVIEDNARVLGADEIDAHRNTGGFDLIGSGRDKIATESQFAACAETCRRRGLDGLVIIGGDDSNTNAAVLAERFRANDVATDVVGVPKTIDGDLKGGAVECSFGFDTATKVYAQLVGNIARDARSAGKYWHFIRLMGRSASHVTLEVALQTHPNVALIGEEVQARGWTLAECIERIASAVVARAREGRSYGICLVPEGLIEFIPEIGALIDELNNALAGDDGKQAIAERLTDDARAVFLSLPTSIRDQLMLDRDSHGNVQVSKIDTEKLLIAKVSETLGGDFRTQHHFFGYEGRCAAPTNFDADYTYALGRTAALLLEEGKSGYIAALTGLADDSARWQPVGVPLTSLMHFETRKGQEVPVIAKALVDLEGAPFSHFADRRDQWMIDDAYLYPGAPQYFGPAEIADARTMTVMLEAERRR